MIDEFENPWDTGGELHSDWGADNNSVLNTEAIATALPSAGSKDVITLSPPYPVKQSSDSTCWAAALQSLFFTTVPREEIIQLGEFFLEKNIILKVKDLEKSKNRALLRNDNSLITIFPTFEKVIEVYNAFLLPFEQPEPNKIFQRVESLIRQGALVMLSFTNPKWMQGDYWFWHDWIISGVKISKQRIYYMDPDYARWPKDGALLPNDWKYYLTWRYMGKNLNMKEMNIE